MLKGNRTYAVALGAIMVAVGSVLTGDMTWADALNTFLIGGGFAALRAAVGEVHKDARTVSSLLEPEAAPGEEAPVSASHRFGGRS